jgi:two-component system OmpR family response regulator
MLERDRMRRVLIVDDNEAYCEALRDALLTDGFAVEVACTGAEAIQSIRASLPDAVILDLMIADIDGETLAEQLGNEGVAVPFIVVSANLALAATARRMKAAGYMSKPFHLPALLNLLHTVAARA